MIPVEAMQIAQTVAIVSGIVILVAKLGGREQMLRDATDNIRELRDIVTRLAHTVTTLATKGDAVEKSLDEIRRRIERLEGK